MDFNSYVTVHPYSELTPGNYTLDEWGGHVLVLATTDPKQVLVVEISTNGEIMACMPWHLGLNEQLADPVRMLRDDEQRPEDHGMLRFTKQ